MNRATLARQQCDCRILTDCDRLAASYLYAWASGLSRPHMVVIWPKGLKLGPPFPRLPWKEHSRLRDGQCKSMIPKIRVVVSYCKNSWFVIFTLDCPALELSSENRCSPLFFSPSLALIICCLPPTFVSPPVTRSSPPGNTHIWALA